ncbi:MAG: hypothetical protein IJ315_06330 [Firmicutes bacterium]|nr:hypothetical protein [Bacillota bacterium]
MNTVLIGMGGLREAIENICANKGMYAHSSVKVPDFIVKLNPGNGQSTVLHFVTECFKENKIRNFRSLDDCLEMKLDGTLGQLRMVMASIRDHAVYTNYYEGVVGMDISALEDRINESQIGVFLDEVKELSKNTTFVFFVPEKVSKNMQMLIDKLNDALDEHVVTFEAHEYSEDELAMIVENAVYEFGIALEDADEFHSVMLDVIAQRQIKNAKEAAGLAEKAIRFADYSGFDPVLSAEMVKNGMMKKGGMEK